MLAAETLERIKPFLPIWAGAAEQIQDASASLEGLIGKSLASGASAAELGEAAERLGVHSSRGAERHRGNPARSRPSG